MRILTVFVLIFVSLAAYAGCRSDLPIAVASGKELNFRISADGKSVSAVVVRLSSAGKLIHTIVAGTDGTFAIDGISEGEYQLFVPGWGTANLEVKPLTDTAFDDLSLPTFALMPGKSKIATINGRNVKVIQCPSITTDW